MTSILPKIYGVHFTEVLPIFPGYIMSLERHRCKLQLDLLAVILFFYFITKTILPNLKTKTPQNPTAYFC